jgi:hypothetical protein
MTVQKISWQCGQMAVAEWSEATACGAAQLNASGTPSYHDAVIGSLIETLGQDRRREGLKILETWLVKPGLAGFVAPV